MGDPYALVSGASQAEGRAVASDLRCGWSSYGRSAAAAARSAEVVRPDQESTPVSSAGVDPARRAHNEATCALIDPSNFTLLGGQLGASDETSWQSSVQHGRSHESSPVASAFSLPFSPNMEAKASSAAVASGLVHSLDVALNGWLMALARSDGGDSGGLTAAHVASAAARETGSQSCHKSDEIWHI
eukprot:TRINITY_DN38107_c0_g1_i1.p1 TRINITY_DN38107_c0_g1~~TRINITY_DN38107_c0_g1_i1.p1  ORF type:complete len:187 (+),score=30.98 TRINITY_DN38107_c0_g1_i1:43-603(+)